MSEEIAAITQAERELALVETPADAKGLYDKLETLQQWAQRYRLDTEQQNEIAVLKLRTARKGGELIAADPKIGRGKQKSRDATFGLPEGLTRSMSSRWQALEKVPEQNFDAWLESLRASDEPVEVTLAEALEFAKQWKSNQLRDKIAERGETIPSDIRVGEFQDVLADVPDDSVDLVFTDPPYDRESVPLYGVMAEWAARALRPGGSLLAYCGHYAIPDIAADMGEHLRWHWLLGCYHAGGQTKLVPGKGVLVAWKPIVWMVKPPFSGPRQIVKDMVERPMPDKTFHDWSQSVEDARYYIEKLTIEDELIVDPFTGGGTTLLVAQALGRRWLGAEKDEPTAQRAAARLHGE